MGHHYVWVGNIPYTTTEEEIREIMSTVGPVVRIRIRYDKDSGQSKGFAFCEYDDPESCALAVKHLHGTIVGGRPIRLDFCSSEQSKSYFLDSQRPPDAPEVSYGSRSFASPALDTSREAEVCRSSSQEPQVSLRVEISRIVQSLSAAQLFYLLGHMQKLVLAAPDFARSLLRENPSLCYALLHAQFICGMVDEPFSRIAEDSETLDGMQRERMRQQMEEAKRLYERSADAWSQRAESVYDTTRTPSVASTPPFILGPPVTQQATTSFRPSTPIPSLPPTPVTAPAVVIPPELPHPHQPPPIIVIPNSNTNTNSNHHHGAPMPPPPFAFSPPVTLYQPRALNASTVPMLHEQQQQQQPVKMMSRSLTDAQSLVGQILEHPDILQQILNVTPEQESAWSEGERAEMMSIRVALRERGFRI